ncbi:purple acid phosphatase family protein [Sphingobacterium faecale]|uniref:Metallophosphoesterase family protein n=1 Tax=Sphingobacterium faecale TaxID=2803775 RepID=A0ABS1R9T6_9SPHI|nr:metallophosphoesterase family protein [Sphingobacterium faecale]MBL1411469.1 metallophosphoesterase family protein [Sphingobacterium faecale]
MNLKQLFLVLILFLGLQKANAQHKIYTVIANPGQNASTEIRLNWHQELGSGKSYITYTQTTDKNWKKAVTIEADQSLCSVFDSIYSKRPNGEDFYEDAKFVRNTVTLQDLKPGTQYQYKLTSGTIDVNNDKDIRMFRTAPGSDRWNMGVISDIHVYAPLPDRQKAGMSMIQQLEKQHKQPFDMMLHVGDLSAWGGSYSFWPTLYADSTFSRYVWAGVNGNHDDMTRQHAQSNAFFRNVNNNPDNGYGDQLGVCYYFTYGNTLFVMLNNEAMKSEEGLTEAQQWMKAVVRDNPSKYLVVVSHYQWFMGGDGRSSQYTRWKQLFDELRVDLAISGNNHIYVRTNALYADKETDGSRGTVYIQTPSADNERGQAMGALQYNQDLIRSRWTEGPNTVGALIMSANKKHLKLTLYDRNGKPLDQVMVKPKSHRKRR